LCFYGISLAVCAGWFVLAHAIYDRSYPAEQLPLVKALAEVNVFGQLPVFAVGIVVYYWSRPGDAPRGDFIRSWIVVLLSSVMIPALWMGLAGALSGRIAFGAAFGVFAFLLGRHPVLVNPVITGIGRISFSMYITQFAILDALDYVSLPSLLGHSIAGVLAYYCAAVGVTAAVSWVCYQAVEQPGIALGKRLIDRLEARTKKRLSSLPILLRD